MDTKDLKAFIRSGGYAWPGGYPTVLQMADGEYIDAQSARENYRRIRDCMRTPCGADPDWTPVEVVAHWEGEPIICAHSGRAIESAYGIPG
jgi:hypothetical protein